MRGACAALLLCGLTGCTDDRPAWSDWRPWQSFHGALRPEVRTRRHSPAAPARLRLVTFNVERAPDVPALARAILGSPALGRAHVLLLQEMEHHPTEPASRARLLADALDPALNYVYAPTRQVDHDATHGLALISRYPLSRVEVMELPYFDLHISSSRQIALGVTVDIDGTPLRLVNVHLDTRINFNQRLLQLEPAVALSPGPLVLGGDFNTNPYTWAERTVPLLPARSIAAIDQAVELDRYLEQQGFSAPTAALGDTTNMPVGYRLDSIYCRVIHAVDAGVAREVEVSDHHPVWIDVLP
jgi:endonuclease/exonuclease/phosphatase family metal-dependent hydrolase